MRRGFMAEATALACQVRAELEIGKFARLDPRTLADSLGVPIWALSALLDQCPDVGYLLTTEPEVFSAVTVFAGPRRTIVHNDGHVPARQNSNLAHELSHALLHHPPTPALDDIGNRNLEPGHRRRSRLPRRMPADDSRGGARHGQGPMDGAGSRSAIRDQRADDQLPDQQDRRAGPGPPRPGRATVTSRC